jgi:hypothetical protein
VGHLGAHGVQVGRGHLDEQGRGGGDPRDPRGAVQGRHRVGVGQVAGAAGEGEQVDHRLAEDGRVGLGEDADDARVDQPSPASATRHRERPA